MTRPIFGTEFFNRVRSAPTESAERERCAAIEAEIIGIEDRRRCQDADNVRIWAFYRSKVDQKLKLFGRGISFYSSSHLFHRDRVRARFLFARAISGDIKIISKRE